MSSMKKALEQGRRVRAEQSARAERNREIPRVKPLEDWTPDDHAAHQRTGEEPVNPEWSEARAALLAKHGLEDEGDYPKALEDMTADDHARRRYGGN